MKQSKEKKIAYALVEIERGWGVACCVEGEAGYHPVSDYDYRGRNGATKMKVQGIVDRLNERAGLTPHAARRIVATTMPTEESSKSANGS